MFSESVYNQFFDEEMSEVNVLWSIIGSYGVIQALNVVLPANLVRTALENKDRKGVEVQQTSSGAHSVGRSEERVDSGLAEVEDS